MLLKGVFINSLYAVGNLFLRIFKLAKFVVLEVAFTIFFQLLTKTTGIYLLAEFVLVRSVLLIFLICTKLLKHFKFIG